ncbi:VTC domain-containing protein [Planococcus sp. MB-3u-03]|uniref:VTC domain-containing protein n=1 Tax=Planococcus sp. MB-3u-03 TaxID=2058136 RepID=UPI001E2FC007|nr:VTC domain-containing protein [Planococcus sp. MB-3u-03]
MAIEIFSRREQKYLITTTQYEFERKLSHHMRNDQNGENGWYTVSSLYFDNAEKDIYFETKQN